MKKLMPIVLVAIMLVFAMTSACFAAPEYIGAYDNGGNASMLSVTNPNKTYSTTYSNSCSISGFATAGSRVYVYSYDSSAGVYKLSYENGAVLSTSVGASGIFVIPVKLSSGSNKFMIRAEKDGLYKNVPISINVLSTSMFSIKSMLRGIKLN